MHVHEGLVGKLAHRVLTNAGEERIPKLVEADLDNAGDVIGDDQRNRTQQEDGQQPRHIDLAIQCIGRPFEEIGNGDQHQLGNEEEEGGPDHPHLQIGSALGPHIGPQVDNGLHRIAGIR